MNDRRMPPAEEPGNAPDGEGPAPRAHGPVRAKSIGLLLGLVAVLLLVVALPLEDWVPVRTPQPEESLDAGLPDGLSPATRTRIIATRAAVREAGRSWRAGYTEISDLSPEQFQKLLGARPPRGEPRLFAAAPTALGDTLDLPARWDWRDWRAVSAAPAQGLCGSCWVFAATGAVESLVRIYDGRSVDLSEQQVLDCNAEGYGCAGGWMTSAYALWKNEGAAAETDFPYEGKDDRPCPPGERLPLARVLEWSPVAPTAADLKRMLLVGPLAVAMHVYPDFQHYQSGVYEHEGVDAINHALLLIGWDDALGAWIVRNSWGRGWGELGCAHVRYGCCRLGSYAHRVGIPAARPIALRHTALTDTLVSESLAIEATVTAVSAALPPASLTVWLDTGAGFDRLVPEVLGSTTHQASYRLPLGRLSAGTLVRYWLEAEDVAGHRTCLPPEGAENPFAFRLRRSVLVEDFEAPGAWTAGLATDDALAGRWAWGAPETSHSPIAWIVQPGRDHTPEGSFCFATGLARGANQEANDVDGGRTTLLSPPYDLHDLDDLQLRFWLWFSNATGANPHEDAFLVEASGDGGRSWVEILRTTEGASRWRRIVLPLDGRLEITDRVRFRFVAVDSLGDSVVEAALDDLDVLAGARTSTGVDSAPLPTVFRARVGPNPARDRATLFLELARDEEVRAIVIDAGGRRVRDLWRGRLPAGRTPIDWDGRDDEGRPAGAGVYWIDLSAGGRRERYRLVFMR